MAVRVAVLQAVVLWAAVLICGPLAVNAQSEETEGTYLLKATPYYSHPETNTIEDSGQNPGIGQGMTESVLEKEALLEVYPDGTKYLTVRFALMDNVSGIRISYQRKGDSGYEKAEYQVMQEDSEKHTADMRFSIPDENVIVKYKLYVEPMGRDVVFFSIFSDAERGSGNFAVTPYEPVQSQDGKSERGGGVYMTAVFALASALAVVIIAFVGYIYYSKKVIGHLKSERKI